MVTTDTVTLWLQQTRSHYGSKNGDSQVMVTTDTVTLWLQQTRSQYGSKNGDSQVMVTTDTVILWLQQTRSHYSYSRHIHIMVTAHIFTLWLQ